MREAGTVGWTYFVDTAFVILQIEELAGFCLIEPVAIASSFLAEPFFLKSLHAHIKMLRDPHEVLLGKGRCHGLAAVGATETIGFQPDFLFVFTDHFIKTAGCIVFKFGKKAPHPGFGSAGLLFEGTKINGLHGAEDKGKKTLSLKGTQINNSLLIHTIAR